MPRYALHITDPLDGTETHTFKHKPSFEDMYSHLDCDMIEMSTAHIPEWSNRKDGYTDIYFDEEGKMKSMVIPNKKSQVLGILGKRIQEDNAFQVILLQVK